MSEKMTIETTSQNTIDAYGVLKGSPGTYFTIAEVAEELGVTSAKVTGGLVSLAKKDVVLKDEKEGTDKNGNVKMYKAFAVNPDFEVEFVAKQKSDGKLNDNAIRLLQFLQKNSGAELTHAELAEELGWQTIQVVGAATTLAKKGFIDKPEVEIEMPDGKTKQLKIVVLTEEGKAYQF